MLCAIRLRGTVGVHPEIRDTLRFMRLNRVNHCVVLPERKEVEGMLRKVKDYIAWGRISRETFRELLRSRGRILGNRRLTDDWVKQHTKFESIDELADAVWDGKIKLRDVPELKPFFRLHPPKGGLGRKGKKKDASQGGALGFHKNLDELLLRMI